MTTNPLPSTLLEAVRYFSDLDIATKFVADLRWPNGPVCPRCDAREHSYLTTRRLWKCKSCKKQFSVKLGTVFEASPLGLDKWLPAVWLAANAKNGISSHELARALRVTQKSAWFMLHRIRLAMQTGSFLKFSRATTAAAIPSSALASETRETIFESSASTASSCTASWSAARS
jgi:transposase-like protein